MKLLYTTRDGRMTVEIEGESQLDLWKQLGRFQEVFENTICSNGKISSDKVNFVCRKQGKFEFYELVCVDKEHKDLYYAKFPMGVLEGGKELYPKGPWKKFDKNKNLEFDIVTGKEIEKED